MALVPPENVAVTALALVIDTVQVRVVPLQAPPQPVNVAPEAGAAVSVTLELGVTFALQVVAPLPQLIPPPVTLPRPLTVTVSATVALVPPEKVAVTVLALVIATVQVRAVPLQAPPQPVKVAPEEGVAVSVTLAVVGVAVQAVAPLPQLIPPPVTVPAPLTETVSTVPATNVAVTVLDSVMEIVQVVVVPPQAPLQPPKVAPVAGVAVSVMLEPGVGLAVQLVPPPPQLIPPPVTVPEPVTETVSETADVVENAAVTLFAAFMRTVQVVSVPPQAPLQPVNVAPSAGVAVSETVSPSGKVAVQTFAFSPQLIAPFSAVTMPLPLTVTVSPTTGANVALTDFASSIRTAHVAELPEQAPSQPVNVKPGAAVAVRITVEFTAWVAVHVEGQLIPPPVTVPLPETATDSRTPLELLQVALTERSVESSTVQATPVPVQAPPQPMKTLPEPGVSTTVSVEPVKTVRAHVDPGGSEPQVMPPPLALPAPEVVTESVLVVVGGPVKLAVTSRFEPSIGTVHAFPAGLGQPVHASKLHPLASVAVSVAFPLPENAM